MTWIVIQFDPDRNQLFSSDPTPWSEGGFTPVTLVWIKLKSQKVWTKQVRYESTLNVLNRKTHLGDNHDKSGSYSTHTHKKKSLFYSKSRLNWTETGLFFPERFSSCISGFTSCLSLLNETERGQSSCCLSFRICAYTIWTMHKCVRDRVCLCVWVLACRQLCVCVSICVHGKG